MQVIQTSKKNTFNVYVFAGLLLTACPRAGIQTQRPCDSDQDCLSWQSCDQGSCTPALRPEDGGREDGPIPDAQPFLDATRSDRFIADNASIDRMHNDAAPADLNLADTIGPDSNLPDTNLPDTARPDTNLPDTRQPDTWQPPPSMCDNYPAINGLIGTGNPIRNYQYHLADGSVHQLCELADSGKSLLYIVFSGFT